jgi:hypothetical protein
MCVSGFGRMECRVVEKKQVMIFGRYEADLRTRKWRGKRLHRRRNRRAEDATRRRPRHGKRAVGRLARCLVRRLAGMLHGHVHGHVDVHFSGSAHCTRRSRERFRIRKRECADGKQPGKVATDDHGPNSNTRRRFLQPPASVNPLNAMRRTVASARPKRRLQPPRWRAVRGVPRQCHTSNT